MYYLIEPLDNFFFRTSVPFEAGGETTAIESLDMPLPSVYACLLYTSYICFSIQYATLPADNTNCN